MKKILLLILLALLFLMTGLGSFVLGSRNQQKQLAIQLDTAQAMLSFNHLMRFREIEADLTKDCTREALERTRIAIDRELVLLSSLEKKNGNTWVRKYISDRDPKLLTQLKNFESRYGNSWKEPECVK